MELQFVTEPDPDGRGRAPSSHGNQAKAAAAPSARQPNRGLAEDAPEFTCAKCHRVLPMAENYTVSGGKGKPRRRTGRCRPCALEVQREANDRQAAKKRGPDYVAPVSAQNRSPVVDGARVCSECGEQKPIDEFYVDKTVKSGYDATCKACRSILKIFAYEDMSPEEKEMYLQASWESWIHRYYGLTVEQYDDMLEAQDGRCAICRSLPEEVPFKDGRVQRFHVDHDHSCCSGKFSCGKCIRALLCGSCNRALAFVEKYGVAPVAEYLGRYAQSH